jgi:hypothetical protein
MIDRVGVEIFIIYGSGEVWAMMTVCSGVGGDITTESSTFRSSFSSES